MQLASRGILRPKWQQCLHRPSHAGWIKYDYHSVAITAILNLAATRPTLPKRFAAYAKQSVLFVSRCCSENQKNPR